MMPDARVHILLPTYEPDAEHLRAALHAVLRQTFTDWILTINDDASKTDVRAMIGDLLTDPRIGFRKNERNLGIGGNWNECVKFIDAPLVQFLFQDDLWEPQYLERMTKMLESDPNIGLVAAHHRYAFEGQVDKTPYENVVTARALHMREGKMEGMPFLLRWIELGLHPNLIGEPSFVMMRAEVMNRVGRFDTSMVQLLDEEYWVRALLTCDLAYVPEPLGSFRVHGGGASARHATASRGMFDRLRVLHTMKKMVPREHRGRVREGLNRACHGFVETFVARRSSLERKGNGMLRALAGFALRHPFLLVDCFFRWLRNRGRFATRAEERVRFGG